MTKAIVEKAIDQGVHRFLADGVHYRDLMDIRAEAADWKSWPETWSRHGEAAEQRAEDALSRGARATATSDFARAALYHHYGQYLLYDDLALKKRIHDRKVAAFARAAPLFDEPFERIEIPFEGIRMGAYFRAPRGVARAPCVILMGGLDTTKEDYLTVNEFCIRRGLATLAFDGPGQGETAFEMPWRQDFEQAVITVIDYLETRDDIDRDRIGLIGRSMGGFYGPKTAAMDDRVKALVAWGVMYHLRNLADVPPHTLEGFLFVSGSRTLDEARAFYECIDLDEYAPKIRCPTLVVHGGRDAITPAENAAMLLEKLDTEVETLIWDDSIHCCHDRAHIVRPAMADFMARHL